MMQQAIILQDLRKDYIKNGIIKHAVNGITMSVDKGDFVGLLGENGAGKSTVINILSSVVRSTSGRVLIGGIDINRNALAAKYKIGVVHQELHLDPFLTVQESLRFHSLYYGLWPDRHYIDSLLDALDLHKYLHVLPRHLSGGMRRRLLIAKALIHNPDIVILDEPSAGIDVELRKRLFAYINFLHREHNKTILLTTHYMEEAQVLCRKIAVLKLGKLVQFDTTSNIVAKSGHRKAIVQIAAQDLTKFIALKHPEWCVVDRVLGTLIFEYNVDRLSQLIMSLHDLHICIEDISIGEPNLADALNHMMYDC